MNKYILKRLINLKIGEFNLLFKQVKQFKDHRIGYVKFPEFGICKNVIQMNRLLKIRRDEIFDLANQL